MRETEPRSEEARTVGSVEITCNIIEEMKVQGGVRVTDIANRVDVAKSTAHAHLATLRDNKMVYKDGGKYYLNLTVVDLARRMSGDQELYDLIIEETRELGKESGGIAHFMMEENGLGVYIYRHAGGNEVNPPGYTGSKEHLHCTALGKAILSGFDEADVRRVIQNHGLPAKTDRTITESDALFREIERIREQGFAYDTGERIEGVGCVAKLVVDAGDSVIGASSISVSLTQFDDDERFSELEAMVEHTANVIEINAARGSWT